jgi:hypothetical protein
MYLVADVAVNTVGYLLVELSMYFDHLNRDLLLNGVCSKR